MTMLLFANNWVGWQVTAWLREQGQPIGGLVLHPPERRRYGAEILAAAGLPPERIFSADRLGEPETLAAIAALEPTIGVSALFGYLLRPPLLGLLPAGCVNIHPAYLPYNRGAHPNIWSIVEGTPAGTTLHYIDAGVDTGDIIAQREVPVDSLDTGETLYRKLEQASVALFVETWPLIAAGRAPRRPQPPSGTAHRVRDLARLDAIELDRSYTARELIDILRARSFAGYPGAYVVRDGRRCYLRLALEEGPEEAGRADSAPQ